MSKKDDNGGTLRGLAMLASMGIAFVVATFIGLGIGLYLDSLFGTRPWLTIIFLILGIAAGFKNMFEMAKRYGGNEGNGGKGGEGGKEKGRTGREGKGEKGRREDGGGSGGDDFDSHGDGDGSDGGDGGGNGD